MRVLYCAIDQQVPGTTGGSVHVRSVAKGLAALGHDVHVLAAPGDGPFPDDGPRWIPVAPPFGARQLRWARSAEVTRIARDLRPDVIIERYYNFGGEGIAAAAAAGALAVLEVNAPVIDHPRSRKAMLDAALVVRPMRRWRDRMCARADLIVTPTASILPPDTARDKVVELEWGADTDRFRPGAPGWSTKRWYVGFLPDCGTTSLSAHRPTHSTATTPTSWIPGQAKNHLQLVHCLSILDSAMGRRRPAMPGCPRLVYLHALIKRGLFDTVFLLSPIKSGDQKYFHMPYSNPVKTKLASHS